MSESVKNLWYFFFAFLTFGLWTIPILIVLVGVAIFYQKIKNAIAKMGVEELVSEFNALVGKRYWCAARAAHDTALIDTLIKKGVDVSAIYDGKTISFARKVVLNPDKTKVLFG